MELPKETIIEICLLMHPDPQLKFIDKEICDRVLAMEKAKIQPWIKGCSKFPFAKLRHTSKIGSFLFCNPRCYHSIGEKLEVTYAYLNLYINARKSISIFNTFDIKAYKDSALASPLESSLKTYFKQFM